MAARDLECAPPDSCALHLEERIQLLKISADFIGRRKHATEAGLTAFAFLLKGTFGAGRGWTAAAVICGQIYGTQRDRGAALGTMIVVALQRHKGDARLGITPGASYKCFTACHT